MNLTGKRTREFIFKIKVYFMYLKRQSYFKSDLLGRDEFNFDGIPHGKVGPITRQEILAFPHGGNIKIQIVS